MYHFTALVTLLSILFYFFTSIQVSKARVAFGIKAPTISGNPDFERYNRVHVNTLEALIVFLPAVWIFSLSVNYHIGVLLGLLFVIARIVYAAGYISAASKRSTGAMATGIINVILVVGGLIALTIKAL